MRAGDAARASTAGADGDEEFFIQGSELVYDNGK